MNFSEYFFELYSDQLWKAKKPELTEDLFLRLNNIRDRNFEINDYFDLDKWAKFFAVMI